MREVIRAIASHDSGYVRWHFDPINGFVPGMSGVFDAVDDFLLNRPGYQVTVVVERDDGTVINATSSPAVLLAATDAV